MITLLATLAATATFSSAAVDHHGPKKDAATVVAEMDTNGDGMVSFEEYAAVKGDEANPEKFAKVAGDDGMLSADEIDAYKAKKHKMKEEKKMEKKEKKSGSYGS